MIRDIHPRTSVGSLERELDRRDLCRLFPTPLVAALVGMSPPFIKRVLSADWNERAGISLAGTLTLLDQDAFAETFVPRSKIPKYLLSLDGRRRSGMPTPISIDADHELLRGNAVDLLPR